MSDSFWRAYCEPLERIREAAGAFRVTMEHWQDLSETTEDDLQPWNFSDMIIGMRGCVQGMTRRQGRVAETWWFSSLLSALYGMLRQDLLIGKVVRDVLLC